MCVFHCRSVKHEEQTQAFPFPYPIHFHLWVSALVPVVEAVVVVEDQAAAEHLGTVDPVPG